jgi:hypothetical protein
MPSDDIFFDSERLQVGDCWPTSGYARHGAIVDIGPYDGDMGFASDYGITGVATFADGSSISIGGTYPGDRELVDKLAYRRAEAEQGVPA